MKIDLKADEALVLFELLASGRLEGVTDGAETEVLSAVLASLERELTEPFREDYKALLENAKKAVLSRSGR